MTKSIIVAIDEQDKASFNRILDSLDPNLCMVKIGSVSFNALGHDIVHSAGQLQRFLLCIFTVQVECMAQYSSLPLIIRVDRPSL